MFNVNQFMQQAQQEQVEKDSSSGYKYPYRVVFVKPVPSTGALLKVRLLPNIKSNQVAYPYWVHKINDQRYDCCYNHGMNECPVCKALKEVKDATGKYLKDATKKRAIVLAQYVASYGYTWSQDNPEPKVGEVIMVMGPGKLYDTVNMTVLNSGPEGVTKILTDVNGAVVAINRDTEGRSIVITPTYETFTSAADQNSYDALLDSLEDIRYITHPKDLSQEEYAKMVEVGQTITKTYLGQQFVNPVQSQPQAIVASQVPHPQSVYNPAQSVQPVQPVSQPVTPVAPVYQQPVASQPVQQQPVQPIQQVQVQPVVPQQQMVNPTQVAPVAPVQQVPVQPVVQPTQVQPVQVQPQQPVGVVAPGTTNQYP